MKIHRYAFAIPALVSLCLAASACTQRANPTVGSITVEQAWIRATPPGAMVAGGFLTIRNDGDQPDRLISIGSPDAASVELHEVLSEKGMMRMRHMARGLPIPAGATVVLKPGSYHLMFIAPKRPLRESETVAAKLRFERAGDGDVTFDIRAMGDMSAAHH